MGGANVVIVTNLLHLCLVPGVIGSMQALEVLKITAEVGGMLNLVTAVLHHCVYK